MKKLLIIALLTISVNSIMAQAKSIYFELGGPGLASINYDMRFTKSENGIGGRVGIGGFSLGFDDGSSSARSSVIFVPLGINYLLGKDTKNYFELGAGVTPVFTSASIDGDSENFSSTFGHVNFGYRLQPQNSGFTFRAFITPVFGKFGFFPYYGGVSFGYKF
ncbi:MAG TPA: hypothetical protein VFV46_02120 [Lacibacter sp.]|nr:hypothetical protein [Lacibacter sp.]